MNHRCAQLTVLPGQEHENHYTVVDRFPFAYARSTDHLTGREDAILKRPDTDPLVIHTDRASEYWHRRASLVVTDTHGRDLAQHGRGSCRERVCQSAEYTRGGDLLKKNKHKA